MKYTTLIDFKRRFASALLDHGKATPDEGRPGSQYRFRKSECKAVGPWICWLANHGYIAECGRPTSKSVSRHNGLTRRWRAIDRAYFKNLLTTLTAGGSQLHLFGKDGGGDE